MANSNKKKLLCMYKKNLRCSFSKIIYRSNLKNTLKLIVEYIHILNAI